MEESNICKIMSDILGHPFVIAIVSILLGSGLIDRVNRLREKREQKRAGAIKTSEEISSVLNNDLSCLFLQVRSESFMIKDEFIIASMDAFKNRLKFKIRISIYFEDDKILKDYDSIIKEMSFLKRTIENYNDNTFDEKLITKHIEELKIKWHINNDYHIEQLKYPFNLYFSWSQVIWYKVETFSSNILRQSLDVK